MFLNDTKNAYSVSTCVCTLRIYLNSTPLRRFIMSIKYEHILCLYNEYYGSVCVCAYYTTIFHIDLF